MKNAIASFLPPFHSTAVRGNPVDSPGEIPEIFVGGNLIGGASYRHYAPQIKHPSSPAPSTGLQRKGIEQNSSELLVHDLPF